MKFRFQLSTIAWQIILSICHFQPLKLYFYEPLKASYREKCCMYLKQHLTARVTSGLFNKAYAQNANISKEEAESHATGIYLPFESKCFHWKRFLSSIVRTGILPNPVNTTMSTSTQSPFLDNLIRIRNKNCGFF